MAGNGFSVSAHFSIYNDTFSFYKDTKCVKKHAISKPASSKTFSSKSPSPDTVWTKRLTDCVNSSSLDTTATEFEIASPPPPEG
jgi:hypothetical protein